MKEKINEHDKTKQMIDIIRNARIVLNEGSDDQKDTISPSKGDSVYNSELRKLQDTVDPRVEITNFKIYPNDNNVVIEGTFLKKEADDSGIKFKMSLSAGEIETSMNNIDLSDKVSILLRKLKGYYENWVDEWALKLAREYKTSNA